MYRCKFFSIRELVCPEYLDAYPEGVLWSRFSPDRLRVLDRIREDFGPVVINGRFGGQVFTESGARAHGTDTGAPLSMHKLWAAFDLKFTETTPLAVQGAILSDPARYAPVTRMEDARITATWLHIDFGNPALDGGIYLFRP